MTSDSRRSPSSPTTNEAADRIRQQHGHRMVGRPGPEASEHLASVLDAALTAARDEGRQEAVREIRADMELHAESHHDANHPICAGFYDVLRGVAGFDASESDHREVIENTDWWETANRTLGDASESPPTPRSFPMNDARGEPICHCGKARPLHWSTCGGVVCRTTGKTLREAERGDASESPPTPDNADENERQAWADVDAGVADRIGVDDPGESPPHFIGDDCIEHYMDHFAALKRDASESPPTDPDMDEKCAKCSHTYGNHIPGGCSQPGPRCQCSGFLHRYSFPPGDASESGQLRGTPVHAVGPMWWQGGPYRTDSTPNGWRAPSTVPPLPSMRKPMNKDIRIITWEDSGQQMASTWTDKDMLIERAKELDATVATVGFVIEWNEDFALVAGSVDNESGLVAGVMKIARSSIKEVSMLR